MWYKKVSIKTGASRKEIWKLWTDVESWNKWDKEVEFSKLNGKFEQGMYGILKPRKGPKSKFILMSVKEEEEFTTRSFLPLAKMDFIHQIDEQNGELYITHGVRISGFLSFLFSKIIGEKIIKELPEAMNNLSKTAEKR